jgi:hypothetical protein
MTHGTPATPAPELIEAAVEEALRNLMDGGNNPTAASITAASKALLDLAASRREAALVAALCPVSIVELLGADWVTRYDR